MADEKGVVVQDAQPAAQPDVKVESSTTPSVQETTQPSDAVKSPSTERVPFNKDPELQRYIDRQVAKREQTFNKQMEEMRNSYIQKLEQFNANRAEQGKGPVNQLPPEQEQALLQLAEMMFSHKGIREKYGFEKISALEKQLSQQSTESGKQMYEAEIQDSISKYAAEYGYDKEELREEFEHFINTDPWFADKPYHKGSVQKAFKLYFSDKSQELAERAANLKLIKEQKEKKSVSTESASLGKTGKAVGVKDKNMLDYLSRREQEEGGIKFD